MLHNRRLFCHDDENKPPSRTQNRSEFLQDDGNITLENQVDDIAAQKAVERGSAERESASIGLTQSRVHLDDDDLDEVRLCALFRRSRRRVEAHEIASEPLSLR